MQSSFKEGSPSLWELMLYYCGVVTALPRRQGRSWRLESMEGRLHPQCCVSRELLAGAVMVC